MNMNKYDKMVEINKERSDEKVTAARLAIRKLMENGEQISVPQLMKMTGLSRGFFYKNPIVRSTLDKALEQQVGMTDPRKNILDMAMDNEIVVSFFILCPYTSVLQSLKCLLFS